MTKCGRVVLIGEPNVGKSSIVNAIVGEQVSIVANQRGTTRGAIRGIKTTSDYQVIFLDTPGMHASHNQLHKYSQKSISHALAEADVILYVLDDIKIEYIKKIQNYKTKAIPVVIAINKTDKTTIQKLYPKLGKLNELEFVREIIPVSAKTGFNLDVLESKLVQMLPVGEIEFSEDDFTDQSIKKIAEEIIRGELTKLLQREIPHGLAVKIADWKEGRREVEIHAEIYCDKPSHKPIIIGKKGTVLKQVGINSRDEIRRVTGKHTKLFTRVLVREDWRNKDGKLKDFGYTH